MGSTAALKPGGALGALERLLAAYGGDAARRKLALLRVLGRARLARARDVSRLHEALCFLRAYPDDARVALQVERMLRGFEQRPDLARHREALANSGIAGTTMRYRFFARMAVWLARRWPERLALSWEEFENAGRLEMFLPLLAHYGETPALDEYDYTPRQWLARMKGPRETDASYLIRRFDRLPADEATREALWDELNPPLSLAPGPGGPSRTLSRAPRGARVPTVFQRVPLDRARPNLREAIARPPRAISVVSPYEGQRYLDLAREAMLTRERDLDVFANGDPRDVRLVDAGGGLEFACMGVLPERRLMFESVYGYLTLKNGVPIGYVLSAALFRSAEVAYNVFETYRGAEAGQVYGRVLGMLHHLFGADAFMVPPYQLGLGNDEGLSSGAWWFYQKLGFRPRDPATRRLMLRELARMRRRPEHRSSKATLKRLSSVNTYYYANRERADVMGRLDLANVGLHITDFLARRFGADRERAAAECAREAARRLGVEGRAWRGADEQRAWERWGPLVMILPGLARWSGSERRAFAAVIRAKGGRRESDFVQAFDAHARLRAAIVRLAKLRPVT